MLGAASVPPEPLPREQAPASVDNREPRSVRADAIRVSTAPRIREASAAAAADVSATSPVGDEQNRARLPAPHRDTLPPPAIQATGDLRALVGRRDPRAPVEAAITWAREVGKNIDMSADDDIVTWADRENRLLDPTTPPERGDLLVFDRVTSDDEADLLGVVIARDERGVTEFLYLGGGVVRRGFVDATRPTVKRDKARAIVNTFVRHGKRWPTKGSHYLAGEHLAHVIR